MRKSRFCCEPYLINVSFVVCSAVFVMDLSVEQESLVAIGSEAFPTSPEILSEESHSLIACSSDECSNVEAKEGNDSV